MNFFRQCCQKCILLLRRNFQRKKFCFKKLLFSDMFSDLVAKISDFCRTFFSRAVNITVYLFRGGPWKEAFSFCQRNFVTRNNFLQVNEITIENFWPPTVSFLAFWRKRSAGILEFNYSCPEELSAKKLLFHKISYFHESFGTLGEQISKIVVHCLAGPLKKQPMCPEVLCDEKQNV